MCIKNNATRKAVETIILTFRLASSNHYQLKNGRRHKPKLTMLLQEIMLKYMFRDLEKYFVSQFIIDTINMTKKQYATSRNR